VSPDEEDVVAYLNKVLIPPVQNEITVQEKIIIIVVWIVLLVIPFVVYSKYSVRYILA
jgi:hypothetical protein